jgi:hypothetical protein
MVVFRDEGTFEPTTEMLIRGEQDQSLDLGVHGILPNFIFSDVMSQNTFIFDHLAFF